MLMYAYVKESVSVYKFGDLKYVFEKMKHTKI